MSIWDQVVAGIPAIIIGVATTVLAAAIIVGARALSGRLTRGSTDFTLTRLPGGNWLIERVKRTTAYDLRYGESPLAGGGYQDLLNSSTAYDNDMKYRDSRWLNLQPGLVWFTWIDGKRRYSRAVDLASTEASMTITGLSAEGTITT